MVDAGGIAAEWVVAGGLGAEHGGGAQSRDEPLPRAAVPGVPPIRKDESRDRAVLYLHGGGYAICSLDTHRKLAGDISRASGMPLLLIDYRLAPEHPHPAAVDDALAAYRWLLDTRHPASRLGLAGDSAGGGLTMATLLAIRDAGLPMPAAAACLSPWVDLECAGESVTTRADLDPMVTGGLLKRMADWYLAGGDARAPLGSPLHGDLSGLPPLLVHVGEAEVLHDDSIRLADRARAAGVDVTLTVYPDMIHVWHSFAGMVPEATEAVAQVGAFLRHHIEDRK